MNRRQFLEATAAGTALGSAVNLQALQSSNPKADQKTFCVWVMGCSHVGSDLRVGKRESLAEAIRQSEERFEAALRVWPGLPRHLPQGRVLHRDALRLQQPDEPAGCGDQASRQKGPRSCKGL